MLFWIILIGSNLAFWFLREYKSGSAGSNYVGFEQLFFCSAIVFVLTFVGVPFLDFKSDRLVEVSDPTYSKLRVVGLLMVVVSAALYFFFLYLENRKHPK